MASPDRTNRDTVKRTPEEWTEAPPPDLFRSWAIAQMDSRSADLTIVDSDNMNSIRIWDITSFSLIEIMTDGKSDADRARLAAAALMRCLDRRSPLRGSPVLFFSSTRPSWLVNKS